MQDGDCPYLARWDAVEAADVIVGGPAHAALDRVVDDRVVIFDEDPGTAYRTGLTQINSQQRFQPFSARTTTCR